MNESLPQPTGNKLTAFMFALLLAFLGMGICLLFSLRFAAGDVFPPYSSLRSDPLGTKAFFQALERLPGMAVRRHYREIALLRDGRGKTIFYAGTGAEHLTAPGKDPAEALEKLAREGNRVVVAFLPVRPGKNSGCAEKEGDAGKKPQHSADMGEKDEESVNMARKWGIEPGYAPAGTEKEPAAPADLARAGDNLPPAVPVHTALRFDVKEAGWETVYAMAGRPVVVERPMGRGSIVLLADSYLLSNEALRGERHPAFLAWLTGANRDVVFDEAHLGVSESPGVMTLMRKYRLQPFLAGLLLVVGLFVWKSAVPLVPAGEGQASENPGTGERSHFTGLVNLLRRSIAPERLLAVCFQEWEKSFAREYERSPEVLERIRTVVAEEEAKPAGKREPLAGYRKIAEIIAERKRT